MLGPKSVFAEECYKGSFIGADFDIHEDQITLKIGETLTLSTDKFGENNLVEEIAAGLA